MYIKFDFITKLVTIETIPVGAATRNGTQCSQTKIANSGIEDDLSFSPSFVR